MCFRGYSTRLDCANSCINNRSCMLSGMEIHIVNSVEEKIKNERDVTGNIKITSVLWPTSNVEIDILPSVSLQTTHCMKS